MKRPHVGRLVRNAIALIISGGGTGIIGIVFWAVAAHAVTAATIGRTSAEIAAMVLLATLSQLSFGSTFERFLPIAGDQTRRFVVRAYVLCTSIALVISVSYVALGLSHRFLPASLPWRALFVAAVVMWTVFALQDSVLVGLRATRWVPVENIIYSLAKLALIPVFVTYSKTQGVLLAWLAPVILIIVAVNLYLFRRRIPEHEQLSAPEERLPSLRELISLTSAQYATLLITIISSSVVSLIVIDRLGPVASAHYYLPAQIASGVSVAVWSIDRSFLVEASSERDSLRVHARAAMRSGLVVLGPCVILGVIFAPLILRLFGRTYANDGTTLLRMFLLAMPSSAVTIFYSSFAWIDRRLWILTVRELASSAVYFTVIIVFIGRLGILAVGVAALTQSVLQGFLFLPLLIRRYRQMPDTKTSEGTDRGPAIDPSI